MNSLYEVMGGKVRLNLHRGQQQAWDSQARFSFIIAGTQGGKCGRFAVLLANGTRKHVKDMTVGDVVLCLGDDLRIHRTKVTDAFCTGEQSVIRVTTKAGRAIEVTPDHPLYSEYGWQPANKFCVGDFIGVPRSLPDLGTETEDPNKMKILGYLLGDGGCTHTSVMFSNVDPEVLTDFAGALPEPCQLVKADGRCTYRVKGYGTGSSSHNPVLRWMREWGIDKLAKEKRIPEFVFTLRKEYIAHMLNALFACDGWIDKKGIGFASASEGLVDDIQHLLLRFGIIARKRYKVVKLNGDLFDSWNLSIADIDQLIVFASKIGILSKQEKLNRLIAKKTDYRANSKDVIPNFDIQSLYRKMGTPPHPQRGGYADREGYALLRGARRGNVSRNLSQLLSDHFNEQCDIAYSDIYWDRVDSIEPMGADTVWDITVENGHNFIADDIFAHNTSFGSWWLWREIQRGGAGDYIAATSSYDLFKLKMLPEIRNVFENILKIGRFWAGEKIIELRNPETGEFQGNRSDDPNMWGRIILRSASAEGGLESATAKAAWLDELGQDDFRVTAWEAVLRRLSLSQGRILGTTTPYNLGWLKQLIYDRWRQGDPDIDVIQFDSTLNPAFPQAEFDRAKATMPEWKFNMFYRGQFTRPAGMIYKDFIDEYRERGGHKVKPFQLSQRFPRYVGVDPGAVNHATLWLAHDTEADIYYAYRETLEGGMSTNEHAGKAYETARTSGENVVMHIVGQASEVQQRLDWQASGVANVTEPPFRDVEAGIDKVIQLLREHRLFFFDDLTKTLDQLGSYARVLDDAGQSTDRIKDKERYHLLDCLRYAAAYITNPPQESFHIAPIVGLYDRRPRV